MSKPLQVSRAICVAAILGAIAFGSGCSQSRLLVEAFPTGRVASPWVLDGAAWSGTFDQAAPGMGADAAAWEKYAPEHVWLAIYRHESRPRQKLIARLLSFSTTAAAHSAYDAIAPLRRKEFKAGDEGCWTGDGVLFRWSRLNIEVFSADPATQPAPEQAVFLVGFLEKRISPELAEKPQ